MIEHRMLVSEWWRRMDQAECEAPPGREEAMFSIILFSIQVGIFKSINKMERFDANTNVEMIQNSSQYPERPQTLF
jgi:hypothetical protein